MVDSSPSVSVKIASELLRIGAVSLSPSKPFTWASGRLSPVYCDNRLSMGYPEVRKEITSGFEKVLAANHIPCELVVGTATAGIPHAAWLAHRLDAPMAYVRSAPKGHGKGNQIEGSATPGSKAVVIEDLVSTGMSSTAVLAPLKEAGVQVQAVLAIFTYGMKAAQTAFGNAGVPLFTLSDFPTLIEVARQQALLSPNELDSLSSWYKDPEAWSKERGGI